MKEALINAIRKPFTNFWGTVYGIILSLIPILNFIAAGHIVQCFKDKKKPEQPKWSHGNYFMDGFFITLITFVYSIPIFIYSNFMEIPAFATRAFLATPVPSWVGTEIDIAIFQDYYLLAITLLVTYSLPAAVMQYIKEDKLLKIFDPRKIKGIIFTKKYFTAYLVGAIFFFGLTFGLNFIPVIGTSIGSYVGLMIFYTLLGGTQ